MLAIAGCSEDNTHPKVSPVDEPSADAVTILATIDAIPSATGDGEAYAPLWQEGDQIIVGYKGMSYVYETYDAGNGVEFHPVALSLPADARGEVTAYFKAVDGVFAVGADQTGATLPMYAYAADAAPAQGSLGLHFKPLASVLSLTIGEEASKTISKITLEPVDPDGVEGHLAVSEAVVDPRTGAVTVGEDAAVSDILTMEIGEMSLVQAQTVNFLIVSGTKVDGGLKATISCTDGSVFVKNLFETQEVAFAGNCVGAATELFFRLRIATYEDMVNFAQECADDNGGAIVDLQADIDMRNVPWTPIENFTGTFNGNGHRIYNINVSADGRYAGFFAYAKGAISDVVFGSKDGTSYDGTSRIELKYSADTDTWCYAGIVAQSNNTLTGVTSFVPVTVTADSRCKSRTGGIVGSLYNGKMSGCRNYGAVSNVATAGVASYVAGIAGIVDGSGDAAGAITLDGCHNHGPVMTSLGLGNAVAGITASVMKTAVNTTISNCTNAGEIWFDNAGASAAHRIGGIVAYIVDSCPTLVIDNCTNKGTVVSNMNGNCFIGGIAGVNYAAAIRDCTNADLPHGRLRHGRPQDRLDGETDGARGQRHTHFRLGFHPLPLRRSLPDGGRSPLLREGLRGCARSPGTAGRKGLRAEGLLHRHVARSRPAGDCRRIPQGDGRRRPHLVDAPAHGQDMGVQRRHRGAARQEPQHTAVAHHAGGHEQEL